MKTELFAEAQIIISRCNNKMLKYEVLLLECPLPFFSKKSLFPPEMNSILSMAVSSEIMLIMLVSLPVLKAERQVKANLEVEEMRYNVRQPS